MWHSSFFSIKPIILIMGFIGVVSFCSLSKGQSVDTIIELHKKAIGGDKILNVKSIYIEGISISGSGKNISLLKIYKSLPDYYRHEFISDNRIIYSCYNGHSHCIGREPYAAWLERLSKLREEHSDEITKPYFIDGLLNPTKDDLINIYNHYDTENYILNVKNIHNDFLYYINKESNLIVKTEIYNSLNNYKEVIKYDKYIEVDGVYFPSIVESTTYNNDIKIIDIRDEYKFIRLNVIINLEIFNCVKDVNK